ncbi:MAG: hypothetical protein N3A54_01250 [Patescibacteria group bacterium]|nr:hypothetical protein [Patescibacteria group bacterium]
MSSEVKIAMRNWWRAFKRGFASSTSFSDRVKIFFGLIFAQPLASISMLFDFKPFWLNRFVNTLGRAMQTPCVLPETESERQEFLRSIWDFVCWKMNERLAVEGVYYTQPEAFPYEYEDEEDFPYEYEDEEFPPEEYEPYYEEDENDPRSS